MTIPDHLSSKVALVTGATGFIGSHLTRKLVADGWAVHVIVRPDTNQRLISGITENLTVHVHDGTTEGMGTIMATARPQVVFHLASLFLAQHTLNDIEPLFKSNILFPTQLVDAMISHDIRLLVNTGTSWQHYDNDAYNPVCLYAATKEACESILQYYCEAAHLNVVTLKLFDTYGPDDPRPKLFSLLRNAARGQTTLSMSPGEQLIDLVYVDDVVEAFITGAHRLLNRQITGHERYPVSSEAPMKLRDIVNTYERVTETRLSIVWGGREYRAREVMAPWSKGKRLPGWQPTIGLEEGIRRMERI